MTNETRKLESDSRLDQLVLEYLEACESETRPSPTQFIDARPTIAKTVGLKEDFLEFLNDQEFFDRLSTTLLPTSCQNEAKDVESPTETVNVRTFGDYELLNEIARGGMGVVYRARQVKLNRIVALKMILSGVLASNEEVRRFQAEAEAAANLHHANIVEIFDVGKHDEQAYFSMQYIEGNSLANLAIKGPIESRQAAEYLVTIADAVHYAHEKGTLHRDLKPANILIDANNQPQITDFGLAKRSQLDTQITLTGDIVGTPTYMSPEQALGKRERIDRTSDVYSLGATLYFILTGRPPLVGETAFETIQHVVNTSPVSPRNHNKQIPKDLENICMKCLEKDPKARFATARDLADDLRRFVRGEPVNARPIKRFARAIRWTQRHPWKLVTALVLISALLWCATDYFRDSGIKRLDARATPYTILSEGKNLTLRFGDNVKIIYEGIEVDPSSQAHGEFFGKGGQNVNVTLDGKSIHSNGANGPLGINRLTVNGRTIELFDHGRQLMVDRPSGGGVSYILSANRKLTIVFSENGEHRATHR